MKIRFVVESPTKSLRSLFGHCQLRAFVSKTVYADIGRFSSSAIDRLRLYKNLDAKGCVLKVGDFCEFANSEILLGGEHVHEQIVNQVLTGCPVFQTLVEKNGFRTEHHSKGPISIGHGVVVSHGAKILSGVTIGSGSVIAAGALVTRDIPDFSIVGGVPAKQIKARSVDREACRAFWDMNLSQVFELTTGKKISGEDIPYTRDHWLIIEMVHEVGDTEGKFSGFEIKGVQTPSGFIQPRKESEFMGYCRQVSKKVGETAEWVSNPFLLNMSS